MIEVIIVDDEAPARSELRYLLEHYSDIQVVGEAASGEEAIRLINQLVPDAVFLDIHLHDREGITIPSALTCSPLIVYATAYDSYAIQAFETEAADYILKPFDEERLARTIERLRRHVNKGIDHPAGERIEDQLRRLIDSVRPSPACTRIPVEKATSVSFLDVAGIVYAEAEGRYSRVFTKDSQYMTTFPLQELERKLPAATFYRIHRTYLVNLDCIAEFIPWFKGTVQIKMNNQAETVLPVSRTLVKDLKQRLGF